MMINYISHLNAAMERLTKDEKLNPNHISLYMALFMEWNCQRFSKSFHIDRTTLMNAAKIGSKTTYHKCLRELDEKDYFEYTPSKSMYRGSRIGMSVFGSPEVHAQDKSAPADVQPLAGGGPGNGQGLNGSVPEFGQGVDKPVPKNGQPLVQNINSNKQKNQIETKRPEGRQAVIDFFISKGFDADEGKKFHVYYKNRDWTTSDQKPIRNWRSLALNWMDRVELLGDQKRKPAEEPFRDYLKTPKIKDYAKPL